MAEKTASSDNHSSNDDNVEPDMVNILNMSREEFTELFHDDTRRTGTNSIVSTRACHTSTRGLIQTDCYAYYHCDAEASPPPPIPFAPPESYTGQIKS